MPFPLHVARRLAPMALVLSVALAMNPLATLHAAGSDAQDARDQAAVNAVTLDMDSATRVAAVTRDAGPALRKSCLFRGDGRDLPLDACAAQTGKQPQVAAALAAHRISAQKYALVLSALMQGSMGAQAAGDAAASEAISELGISPAHVHFVQAHQAELDRLFGGKLAN